MIHFLTTNCTTYYFYLPYHAKKVMLRTKFKRRLHYHELRATDCCFLCVRFCTKQPQQALCYSEHNFLDTMRAISQKMNDKKCTQFELERYVCIEPSFAPVRDTYQLNTKFIRQCLTHSELIWMRTMNLARRQVRRMVECDRCNVNVHYGTWELGK